MLSSPSGETTISYLFILNSPSSKAVFGVGAGSLLPPLNRSGGVEQYAQPDKNGSKISDYPCKLNNVFIFFAAKNLLNKEQQKSTGFAMFLFNPLYLFEKNVIIKYL